MWRETAGNRDGTPYTGFQSTPSVWRETFDSTSNLAPRMLFQSTPSVWRETLQTDAARGGSGLKFNPLPPCGGRRRNDYRSSTGAANFNPLPPCGGRQHRLQPICSPSYFNPLPPCGGRHLWYNVISTRHRFQSTPSVWRETREWTRKTKRRAFQSTPSVWRETLIVILRLISGLISIHSLRVEGDFVSAQSIHQFGISIHSLRVEGDALDQLLLRL